MNFNRSRKPNVQRFWEKVQKKRLSGRRKAVTLIVGLLCSNGILLCSDREENTAYIGKRSVRKIHDYCCREWSMCIATAGRSSVADLAARGLVAAAKLSKEMFLPNHATVITDTLIEIMKRHVYNKMLSDQERRDRKIDLVIGISDNESGLRYLYKIDDEILCPCDEFACAGYGEDIATYFLARLFETALLCEEADILARFILREAKESVQTVGQETEIVTVSSDGMVGRNTYSLVADTFDVPRHLALAIHAFWRKKKPEGMLGRAFFSKPDSEVK